MTENAIDLVKEFTVIAGAPVSFAIAVILATGVTGTVIYFILKSRYQGQVDAQGAHIVNWHRKLTHLYTKNQQPT